MKDFTISRKKPAKLWYRVVAVLVWLLVWQLASAVIRQEMLLASPVSVAKRLWELLREPSFWNSVVFSLSRVALGFLLAFALGVALAAAAYRLRWLEILLQPLMGIIKATPVASYIILLLLFLPSRNLSTFISLMMSLPVLYTNVLHGLENTDKKLLEMAHVFGMGAGRQALYIYLSQLMPFLASACSLALGLCWKAGIAAEVIGIPLGSIGERMYQAKIFVDTRTLLAWTVVVVAVSFLFERAFLYGLKKIVAAVERL